MSKQPTCEERVEGEFEHEYERVKSFLALIESGEEANEEGERPEEYGLSFDYVAPGTFKNQDRGYFRFQISTGGPGDEFRFYLTEQLRPHAIEYWYLDWFDGACHILTGEERETLTRWWDWLTCDNDEEHLRRMIEQGEEFAA